MKYKIVALFLLLALVMTSGFGCKTASKEVQEKMKPITLEYWRVYDDSDAFEQIIADYNALHPFVTINYKKLLFEEYEKELINALAEDRGPDIFSIQSTWIPSYQKKLAPMPSQITMVYPITKGSIKKETIPEVRTTKSISLKEIQEKFVDIVYSDVILDNEGIKRVYGLPLAVDTMVLYYNRDLLNNAGIVEPPKFWDKTFQQSVKKLTKQNNKGQIIQSGISFGGTKNVERSADILALLMMQNGSTMMDANGRVLFHTIPSSLTHHPGIGALEFYSDFSNPSKEVYCWNSNQQNSLDMFIQGNLAMMMGYAYHLPIIKSRAPKLNFAISKSPQIEDNPQINHANYWVESVSAKSKYINEAWDFIQFLTKAEQAKKYLEKTKKPTALRALVQEQIDDLDIGVFAEQVVTAKSWYHGMDVAKAEEAMDEMIDLAITGEKELDDIISQGANKVLQTVK